MGPLRPEQPQDMHLLLAIATFVGAATAMPMVYYPAQYIPADEVLVRMPRQLPQGLQGPLRPVRQSDFAADQEASADTAYGAAPTPERSLPSEILQKEWVASRSKCTGVPARARAMTLSPPGVTTT